MYWRRGAGHYTHFPVLSDALPAFNGPSSVPALFKPLPPLNPLPPGAPPTSSPSLFNACPPQAPPTPLEPLSPGAPPTLSPSHLKPLPPRCVPSSTSSSPSGAPPVLLKPLSPTSSPSHLSKPSQFKPLPPPAPRPRPPPRPLPHLGACGRPAVLALWRCLLEQHTPWPNLAMLPLPGLPRADAPVEGQRGRCGGVGVGGGDGPEVGCC